MIDWTKPIQTADGLNARHISNKMRGPYRHLVVVSDTEYNDKACLCKNDGSTPSCSVSKIVNVPERIQAEQWINVYSANSRIYLNYFWAREEADKWAEPGRVSCFHLNIDVPMGHGLEGK